MNFLKSIISEDPDPDRSLKQPRDVDDGWSFGGLIKTLTEQSESMIEVYRRDLKGFGSGLIKETEILRETAGRAVKDLPASVEAAHGALDGVLKSTASIISKESLGFASDSEETPGTNRSLNSGRYSRFEAQVSAILSDSNTFCFEPEDVEDYTKWKLGFELGNYADEIEGLIGENGNLEGVYKRVVPNSVDRETFWCRYFYRVDKLKQQESLRAKLVRRAMSIDDEELSSWDFDDDDAKDYEGRNVEGGDMKRDNLITVNANVRASEVDEDNDENNAPQDNRERGGGDANAGGDGKSDMVESSSMDVSLGEKEEKDETVGEVKSEVESVKDMNDEKVDLGWDEIENAGCGDEKRISGTTGGGSLEKDGLPKQLTAAGHDDDDEELSWDIEDDDDDDGGQN